MTRNACLRPSWFAIFALGLLLCYTTAGCSDTTQTPTPVETTPSQVLNPEPTAPKTPASGDAAQAPAADTSAAPAAAKPEGTPTEPEKPAAEPKEPTREPLSATATATQPPVEPAAAGAAETPANGVTLIPVKFDEMLKRIAANKEAKLTMVDAWATWCGPCKENFPHVVEMNKKFRDKGLVVISLSMDDPTNEKAIEEAKKFLVERNATFTNFLLNETQEDGFEKLDTNGIPAVFLYRPDGKEVKRFTMDDPNKQFTYDEVEKTVAEMLEGK